MAELSEEEDHLPDFLDKGRDAGKGAADRVVFEVDGETLVQNVQTPYLFITFKPYADRSQILKGDLSALAQETSSFMPHLAMRDSDSKGRSEAKKLSNHKMAAISFAATNFPMENMI